MCLIIQIVTRLIPALMLLAGLPVQAAQPSGFLTRLEGFAPYHLDRAPIDSPVTVPPAEGLVIVIYSHGTKSASGRTNCLRENVDPPASLSRLEGERLRIFFLCSDVVEGEGPQGNYVYGRAEEIAKTVRRLVTAGVPPSRIVLAGHSAGGWSSLMLQATQDLGIAGVVAFAPAFAGPKIGESLGLTWRTVARPAQIKQLVSGRPLRALVFAYEGDAFEEPDDLRFLTQAFPDSVEVVGYSCKGVREAHFTIRGDCREEDTARRIRAFIDQAVQRAGARDQR